jgi:manganese/zinc/iron transport system permease protein
MHSIIPSFDWHRVVIAPWTDHLASSGWVVLMGFFVTASCGLVGTFLILRRMALVGDAISHSVLPGLALGFMVANSRSSWVMFLGAVAAGIVTTLLIELIHKKSRIKQDAAIGITFSTLFALGVILISLNASKVDLDQECVLYGEIGTVWVDPTVVWRMGGVALLVAGLITLFYKELLVSSFDPSLAFSLGINASIVHYSLMCVLSVVVVSAFESVGAILVIAMLILPGATASLLSHKLPVLLWLTVLDAALSSLLGLHLGVWMQCSIAGAMVVVGGILFVAAWILSPSQGLVANPTSRIRFWLRRSLRRSALGRGDHGHERSESATTG